MPELPTSPSISIASLRASAERFERLRITNPFVLRSVTPTPAEVQGLRVIGLRRMGKRIVLELEGERFLVIHLMIAGRLRWRPAGAAATGKATLAALEFPTGILLLTEAGSTRRASLHLVAGENALRAFDRGGLEVLEVDCETFAGRLVAENHTLKRALTDPRLFSGIGNAYSDEILHRARLSPLALTRKLDAEAIGRLFAATQATLRDWTARLRAEAGDGFPEKVTAFREGMAVHGRYGEPCPDCGTPVQRIRYATNETNYCARCQTGGRLLADRALSRILREDWPRSIDQVE